MVLLIDNYDSFSYNLYQLVGSIDPDIKVIRNDELTLEQIEALHPRRIILSPVRVSQVKAASAKMLFVISAVKFPCLVSVLAIRQSARYSVRPLLMQRS